MTKLQFDETKFYSGMEARFNGDVYKVETADFERKTFGIFIENMAMVIDRPCEECELI